MYDVKKKIKEYNKLADASTPKSGQKPTSRKDRAATVEAVRDIKKDTKQVKIDNDKTNDLESVTNHLQILGKQRYKFKDKVIKIDEIYMALDALT